MSETQSNFEWDADKDRLNQEKHGVSFIVAQRAFNDPNRVIARDNDHSSQREERFFCFAKVDDEVLTVRFTPRADKIRIFGAGYWRKGRKIYEEKN